MLLDHLGHSAAAAELRTAIDAVLLAGIRTGDLGGTATCREFGAAVRAQISQAINQREKAAA